MKLLTFRAKAVPRVEVRLSDALCAEKFPGWAVTAGYVPVAFGVPKPGDMFYDPVRDKVKTCGQWRHDALETQPFMIVEWNGERHGTD